MYVDLNRCATFPILIILIVLFFQFTSLSKLTFLNRCSFSAVLLQIIFILPPHTPCNYCSCHAECIEPYSSDLPLANDSILYQIILRCWKLLLLRAICVMCMKHAGLSTNPSIWTVNEIEHAKYDWIRACPFVAMIHTMLGHFELERISKFVIATVTRPSRFVLADDFEYILRLPSRTILSTIHVCIPVSDIANIERLSPFVLVWILIHNAFLYFSSR